jgi:hypothetical protein
MEHDALSVSMFWAGALMAFAPLLFVGVVLFFWWRSRASPHAPTGGDGRGDPGGPCGQSASASAQARGSATRPK